MSSITDKIDVSVRYEVLRNNAFYKQIYAKGTPAVTMSSASELKTSLSGEFYEYSSLGINFLSDRLRPVVKINGSEYNAGVYCVTSEIKKKSSGAKTVSIEAYSLLYLLQQSKIEDRLYYSAGTLYTDVLAEQLTAAGITAYEIGVSTLLLSTAREDWEIGTPRLQIINQLLSEMSFNTVYADADGKVICSAYTAPVRSNIKFEYRTGQYSIIGSDYTRENDYHGKCNIFKIICSNPDLPAPLTAVSENNDMSSPFNISSVGRVLNVTNIDNIASQDALQAKADELKMKSLLSTEKVTFDTVINPEHGVFDTIALYNDELDGIFAETDWMMPLSGAVMMRHSGKRALYD